MKIFGKILRTAGKRSGNSTIAVVAIAVGLTKLVSQIATGIKEEKEKKKNT